MALEAYLKIQGTSQGPISDNSSNSDSIGQVAKSESANHGLITVVGFISGIVLPRDLASGVVTGARNHQPVVFTKYFDRASPLLWQALAKNEVLTEVKCEFYRPHPTGQPAPQKFFAITWNDATLVEGKAYVPLVIDPANRHFQCMEDWSFTYKKVKWEHLVATTQGEDAW